MPHPIIAKVYRNNILDSFHRGSWALSDPDGNILWSAGDIDRPVYIRSCSKIFQTLPLIESGAADRFGITDEELVIIASSHNAELYHQKLVRSILAKIGLDESKLQCGSHPPHHIPTRNQVVADGIGFIPIHNNCSGKHSGMLALALHLGESISDYTLPSHPVQVLAKRSYARVAGVDEDSIRIGYDGCDVPAFITSLRTASRATARFVTPESLNDSTLKKAIIRLTKAIIKYPFTLAGEGRFCTAFIRAGGGSVIGKTGAEASYLAGLFEYNLGLMMKVDDGNFRASYPFLANIFAKMGVIDTGNKEIQPFLKPEVRNYVNRVVGHIEVPAAILDSVPQLGD